MAKCQMAFRNRPGFTIKHLANEIPGRELNESTTTLLYRQIFGNGVWIKTEVETVNIVAEPRRKMCFWYSWRETWAEGRPP